MVTRMLYEPTGSGGLGFCHDALSFLPTDYHGPLVMSLDSNILIDLREYGAVLLDGDHVPDHDQGYLRDLTGLGEILNVWLGRDIRFVVTPRSLTDARKCTERFRNSQAPAVDALAEALVFQTEGWNESAPWVAPPSPLVGDETGLPAGADRDLVLEAQAMGAHVFLTRDKRVLRRAQLSGPQLAIMSPAEFAGVLRNNDVNVYRGGTCGSQSCPYGRWSLPFPDTGKWSPLLSLFDHY